MSPEAGDATETKDSIVWNDERKVVDVRDFADKLSAIMKIIKADRIDLFINILCDAFLLGLNNAREEAINRIKIV